jgi:formylmethanofuran dehydrogenase subunit B
VPDFGPVTCAGCGLLCDDVSVTFSDDAVRLEPPCPLGTEWFSERIVRPPGEPAATIEGQPVDVELALARAAELLRGAHRPLLHGFDGATVEDARAAVALADRLGALIATDGSSGPWAGTPAVSLRGASSATLGEIRDRARLLVIWREDPETSHPRLLERLGFGRDASERTLVVIGDRDTSTAARAEHRVGWDAGRDLEALVALHAMQRGVAASADDLASQLARLLALIEAVPHVAFVYGTALTTGAGGQRRALALHELVRALCRERHAVTLELPRAPGARSADDVLAWQSGYSGKVDFAGGHPEFVTAPRPFDDVDMTLLVEGPRTGRAEVALASLPAGSDVEVWIRTAAAGVAASGTAHRLDGVPLTLQSPLSSDAPTAAALLTRLLAEVET